MRYDEIAWIWKLKIYIHVHGSNMNDFLALVIDIERAIALYGYVIMSCTSYVYRIIDMGTERNYMLNKNNII